MRVAALYDVHGNLPALEAVLADVARAGVDRIVFGGDVSAGPWPAETLDLALSLGDRALFVLGNADANPDTWLRERIGDERDAIVHGWPLTVTLDVDGLGRVLFCHSTPLSNEVIFTRITPGERMRELLAGAEADVVVHGHVHVRYDRSVAGVRVVNPGSVGLPYEDHRGAYWAILGPDVEHRRTEYDVDAMIAAAREAGYPDVDERFRESLIEPLGADEVTQYFEDLVRGS